MMAGNWESWRLAFGGAGGRDQLPRAALQDCDANILMQRLRSLTHSGWSGVARKKKRFAGGLQHIGVSSHICGRRSEDFPFRRFLTRDAGRAGVLVLPCHVGRAGTR